MKNSFNLPIWVLNLKRDESKRIFMENQLKSFEVQYEIIDAVDGGLLTEEEKSCYSRKDALNKYRRELTSGEIGCAISHIRMWQRILEEGHKEVLILEDDVYLGKALFEVLSQREKFPKGYELINFSTSAAQVPIGDFIKDIYRATRFESQPFLTSAYLITKTGARKLLDSIIPFYMPIDDHISLSKIRSYGIFPKTVVLADFGSSIGKRIKPEKPGFLTRKYWEFKAIFRAIAIFFGFSSEFLTKTRVSIDHLIVKTKYRFCKRK